MPVAALVTLLGGVDFGAIVGLFVVSVSAAVIGCVLSLTISVWAAKTHDVLMAVYMICTLALCAANLGRTFCERKAPWPAGLV